MSEQFLTKARDRWPLLPDAALEKCSDDERAAIRGIETHAIELEFAALSDIILHCHNKYQFAKTYKVLRADLQNTFSKSGGGNPNCRAEMNEAVKAALQLVVQQKLAEMAAWFYCRFATESELKQVDKTFRPADAIEQYAGKEGASGCLGVIVLLSLGAILVPLVYSVLS